MGRTGKWIDGLASDMPAIDAAHAVLRERLDQAARLARRLHATPDPDKLPPMIHKLRVATRRGAAAIDVFADCLPSRPARRVRKCLSRLRRAAGPARDCDALAVSFRAAFDPPRSRAKKSDKAPRVAELPIRPPRLSAGLRSFLSTKLTARREEALAPLDAALVDLFARKPPERAKLSANAAPGKLGKLNRLLLETIDDDARPKRRAAFRADSSPTLADLASRTLRRRIDAIRAAADADLRDHAALHDLRLQLKRLRYELEIILSPSDHDARNNIAHSLEGLQHRLGLVTDARNLAPLIGVLIDEPEVPVAPRRRKELDAILHHAHANADRLHEEFLGSWTREILETLLAQCLGALPPIEGRALSKPPSLTPASLGRSVGSIVEPKPTKTVRVRAHLNGSATHSTPGPSPAKARLAAIDVGTNSVRLIVAEAFPDLSYRVLDDEKEMTRLGRGLHATGRMDPDAIQHTVAAVERMASIARGYGATVVRVIGTAAAREASNSGKLADAIRAAAGVELELISGEQEALLAYGSAANAFDLRSLPAAVVDIGGGSTEIVLSVGAATQAAVVRSPGGVGAGVIERVFSIPLGAVKLTDKFGGPDAASGERYRELRDHVRRVVKDHLGRPPIAPAILIGTGGTFTTLAAVVAHRQLGAGADGLFAGAVQGMALNRPDVRHWLDYLRKLPVRQRSRIEGLPEERADIIIAGIAMVDALMRRLGVNQARVHEGGIRDGLMLAMVRDFFSRVGPLRSSTTDTMTIPAVPRPNNIRADGGDSAGTHPAVPGIDWAVGTESRSPMRAVKRFAKACNYEAAHARHVAKLSLQIYDALAPVVSGQPVHAPLKGDAERLPVLGERERTLIEAAALLHDIGYLINYASHHKHSYHLIVHADLPGLTSREVQVIANVARYHRAAEPKRKHRNFALLSPEERTLVRALAAILRVADGLDRTHMQSVEAVTLRLTRRSAHFRAAAADEPAVDMWGAVRKAQLFRSVFGKVAEFEWLQAEAVAPGQPSAATV